MMSIVETVEQTPFGPAAPSLGWVPAPRYALRRSRILAAIRRLKPGRLLEVGSGAGALLCELSHRGFDCTGLETSVEAHQLAGEFAVGLSPSTIQLCTAPNWTEPFDYVTSFEVLEHIEDDESALRQWVSWLKPGGQLLLSVPARQRLWSSSDVWAGHYRRYEKAELRALLRKAGLTITRFESYGFPLSNWVEPIRAYVHRRSLHAATDTRNQQQMTNRSGTDREALVGFFALYGRFPGAAVLWGFCQVQRLFLRTDWGTGYFVVAGR